MSNLWEYLNYSHISGLWDLDLVQKSQNTKSQIYHDICISEKNDLRISYTEVFFLSDPRN